MIELFLTKSAAPCGGNEDVVRGRILLLQRLEKVIWAVIASGNYQEARLWLCSTISNISSITAHSQHKLFRELLKPGKSSKKVAAQLLRMMFEKRPQKVGSVIGKMGDILESFFKGNPQRILQWFDHFASTSEAGHKKGARALSQFAFVNRDVCWEELEWKGKHGQSPAVVATKPHYFHDLDVLTTVENFLEHIPEFWSSDELAASVQDGEILQIDMQFFVERFVFLMYEEHSIDIWAVVDEFLLEEIFSSLSGRLLILLDESELYFVLDFLSKCITGGLLNDFDDASSWLEALLSLKNERIPINDFILLNALISRGRHLLHLLLGDEYEEECQEIEGLLQSNKSFSFDDHYSLMSKCTKMELQVAMKWIALQSWLVHFILFKECKTKECYETLFAKNGINFKRSAGYSFLLPDEFSMSSKSDNEQEDKRGISRKKKRRKRKLMVEEMDVCDSIDFEMYGGADMCSTGVSWLLSTDDYSNTWNLADLPEHLSRYCFKIWMKWMFSQAS